MAAGIGAPARQSQPSKRADRAKQRTRQQNWKSALNQLRQRAAPLIAFWTKINNDWIFNWASALAYTLLTSILPILLVILAIGGFFLGTLPFSSVEHLQSTLAGGLPGGESGAGGQVVNAALMQLNRNAGFFLIIGVVGAIIAGSGLFLSLESVFGIVFRLRGRDPIPQRIMAVSMVLLYVVLVPILVLASLLPSTLLGVLHISQQNPGGAVLIQALGLLVGLASAFLLFGAIYFVVPNRRMRLGEVWPGTVVGAVLLVLYQMAFPIYQSLFLRDSSSTIVGFVVVILIFFYYLAFILLLGAEINSMVLGLRPTTESLSALLQTLQEQDIMIEPETTEASGAADHDHGAVPPSSAGVRKDSAHPPGMTGSGDAGKTMAAGRPVMMPRQRATLAILLIAGSIGAVALARLGKRLIYGEDDRVG
jgi:YihY family inner membrane protein